MYFAELDFESDEQEFGLRGVKSKKICSHHRLRGSASPVLTATGFVNGKGKFSTPTESTPLNRSPKNLSQVIMSATPTAVPN